MSVPPIIKALLGKPDTAVIFSAGNCPVCDSFNYWPDLQYVCGACMARALVGSDQAKSGIGTEMSE